MLRDAGQIQGAEIREELLVDVRRVGADHGTAVQDGNLALRDLLGHAVPGELAGDEDPQVGAGVPRRESHGRLPLSRMAVGGSSQQLCAQAGAGVAGGSLLGWGGPGAAPRAAPSSSQRGRSKSCQGLPVRTPHAGEHTHL